MKKLLLAVFSLGIFATATAQKLNPAPLVAGVESDINYLSRGFLSPLGDAIGAGLNNGWYHTAKTHKAGRFGISLAPMLIRVPDHRTTFTIEQSKLQELELVDPNDNVTPTAFGEDKPGVRLEYKANFGPVSQSEEFNMPAGYGFQYMPLFTFGASVGLPLNTDVSIRYLPQLSIPGLEDTRISLYGAGVTHDILQFIPVANKLPFDASLFVGFTNLEFEQDIEDSGADDEATLAISTRSYTTRLLVSKKILFLTLYGGVGYNGGESRIQLLGTYTYMNPLDLQSPEEQVKDPIDFTTSDFNGVVGNAGFRLKFLWVAYFAADYTFGPYDALTTNLGVSIDF